MMVDDFYVGYSREASPLIARRLQAISIGLVLITGVVSAILVFAQAPFGSSRFEFGVTRNYEGAISERPVPTLFTRDGPFLLVAPGKHGFEAAAFDQKAVRLKGSLIERDGARMIEVSSVTIQPIRAEFPNAVDLSHVDLAGEIVDSKCYLGVMNPGGTKVHRDCAARCISGGVPPAFMARDSRGSDRILFLVGMDRSTLLGYVAEPVEISGHLQRFGRMMTLTIEGIKRVPRRIP